MEGTSLAREGTMFAKKLLNLVAIREGSEQTPVLSFRFLFRNNLINN